MNINFNVCKTLYYESCVAVVSALWNHPDIIFHLKSNLFFGGTFMQWGEVENNVLHKIENNSDIPDTVKSKLKDFIQPMGMQILEWIKMHFTLLLFADSGVKLIFIWSGKGFLDSQKTAEAIIHCNPSYPKLCFCLACIFGIQDIVSKLESTVLVEYVYEKLAKCNFTVPCSVNPVLEFWVCNLYTKRCTMKEVVNNMSFKDVLRYIRDVKYVPVLKYFYENVSEDKKHLMLHFMLNNICSIHKKDERNGVLLRYLFSICDQSVVNEFVTNNAYTTLLCFLEWPCLELFLPALNNFWDHISSALYLYVELFTRIAECISECHMCQEYQTVLKIFLKSSPVDCKVYLYDSCIRLDTLHMLYRLKNSDCIAKIFLNAAIPEIREDIIFSMKGMEVCDYLVRRKRWNSLQMFVTSCIPSIEILNLFVLQYKEFAENNYGNGKWDPRFLMEINNWF